MIDPEQITQWLQKAREQFDQVRERSADVDVNVRNFAREQPVAAVLCALAGGYLVARLSTMRFR